jgi:formylmethanofuran dehydrogenase subunit E
MDLANTGLGVPNMPAATVACDDCGYLMPTPTVRNAFGEIPGRYVCSQCVEDYLEASRD